MDQIGNLTDLQSNIFQAEAVVSKSLLQLSNTYPEYCNSSGVLFWPVPLLFPSLLSETINRLHKFCVFSYRENKIENYKLAIRLRILLFSLAGKGGDLGEDHCGLYLSEHPLITSNKFRYFDFPFEKFFERLNEIVDPFILLGVVLRNELASSVEIDLLSKLNIINQGSYYSVHSREEPKHANLSAEILTLLRGTEFEGHIHQGMLIHDQAYLNCCNVKKNGWAPSNSAA